MPVKFVEGDLFESNAQILVNPCNCVGVAGGGLSAEFAKRFPRSITEYKRRCNNPGMTVGQPWMTPFMENNQQVYHFPTKMHWRKPSEFQWILDGLLHMNKFRFYLPHLETDTWAFPLLGTGLGGLDIRAVARSMYAELNMFGADITIYIQPNAQTVTSTVKAEIETYILNNGHIESQPAKVEDKA